MRLTPVTTRVLVTFVVAWLVLRPTSAFAWNALGHRVIADIAWQQLDAETRQEIVDTLRRHPRYDDDFAKKAPTEGDQDRWIFGQAAVWPDMIRGNREFDHPTWHYINHPIFVGDERPVTFNRHDLPAGDPTSFNVVQAISHSQMVLTSDASPSEKAVAYCWLFHLIGDIHQPLHAVSLVCEKLPEGDRGGNLIPVVQGRNLHALWDNLLGRSDEPNDVKRAIVELEKHPDWFEVNSKVGTPAWVAESRELAESFVYCPEIIAAVEQPDELTPINLPEPYLIAAGEKARQRVVAAGLRLAAELGAAEQSGPIPIEEFEKLPIGINVVHEPESALATLTGESKVRGKYTWWYKTTVSAVEGEVRVVEFGAFVRVGGKWGQTATFTGKPYAAKEFAEWYTCPDAVLKKGQSYSDPTNWSSGPELNAATMRWYFVGVDAQGHKLRGEAVVDLKAELE